MVVDDSEVGCYYYRYHRRRLVTPLVSYYSLFDIWFDISFVFHLIN